MKQSLTTAAAVATALTAMLTGCEQTDRDTAMHETTAQGSELLSAASPAPSAPTDNILLAEWTGPFDGVPAFDKMDLSQLKAGLEAGMAMNLAEMDVIANNAEAATFDNTIVAMERTGAPLGRLFSYYGIWSSNLSSPEFREIQQEMAPKLSAFNSKIIQNDKLFQRIRSVYEGDELKTLHPDQQRLVQLTYDQFARNGATLNQQDKARYAAINERLAEVHTRFANNVLADEEGYVLYSTLR